MKSIKLYAATAFLMTFINLVTLICEHECQSVAGMILLIPASIPVYATVELCSKLGLDFAVDFGVATTSIFLAISLVINLLICLPILYFPKFKRGKNCVITQVIFLLVYLLANIPFWINIYEIAW